MISERRRFDSSRRCLAARDGLVFRRRLGSWAAAVSRARKRSRTACRFPSCERTAVVDLRIGCRTGGGEALAGHLLQALDRALAQPRDRVDRHPKLSLGVQLVDVLPARAAAASVLKAHRRLSDAYPRNDLVARLIHTPSSVGPAAGVANGGSE